MRIAMAAAALLLLVVPEAGVERLSFMAGRWQGDSDGVAMEEVWTTPRGGTMLGLHRDVAGGRTVSFEFLRIQEEKDGIVYWASPEGRPATPFRLTESGPRRAVFANPEHDFPKRILYWLDDTDALHARVEGGATGEKAMEWRWPRAR